ncbi:MAG TPA: hypothetical protein VFZ00_31995 [Solirubrobacter sp.]|jgi:hypothetical protein|nr:hypothetical protein [Solirubrobacter sp.]
MPARGSAEKRLSEGAVRAAVIRLSRPDGDGGAVVERAAILAEGTPAAAIEAWIIEHGGEAEVPPRAAPAPGLYGLRPDRPTIAAGERPPRRYVLPVTALDAQPTPDENTAPS